MNIQILKRANFLLIIALFLVQTASFAQQRRQPAADSTKKQLLKYFKNRFHSDTVKAAKVYAIQEAYKSGLYELMRNNSLNDKQLKVAKDSLQAKKNRQLSVLLTLDEQATIIPSTEREKMKPAIKH